MCNNINALTFDRSVPIFSVWIKKQNFYWYSIATMNQLATSLLIEPLNTQGGHIPEWIERFDFTVSIQPTVTACADGVAKEQLKATFLLSCLGEEGYCLIKASLAPDKLTDKTYTELKEAILALAPKHSAISESYKLSHLKQEPGESLNIYMSRLKEVAVKCDYRTSFDRIVRDKFICGLRSEKIRAHLMNDDTIETAAQALAKAISRENAAEAAHGMSSNFVTKPSFIPKKGQKGKNNNQFKVGGGNTKNNSQNSRENSIQCSKCTMYGHRAQDCRTRCRYCKKVAGHIAKNCPKKMGKQVKHTDLGVGGDVVEDSVETDPDEHLFEYMHHVQLSPLQNPPCTLSNPSVHPSSEGKKI